MLRPDAQGRLATAKSEDTNLREELTRLEESRKQGRDNLVTLEAVASAVLRDSTVAQAIDEAKHDLDLRAGAELEQVRRFATDTASFAARLSRLWRLLAPSSRQRLRRQLWGAGAIAAVLCVVVPMTIESFAPIAIRVAAALAAVALPIATVGRRAVRILAHALESAETAADIAVAVERRVKEQRSATEIAILTDLQRLDATELKLRQEIAATRVRLLDAQSQLEEVQPDRLLMNFIEERNRSGDYRSQLGTIALLRRDFIRLDELLRRSRFEEGGSTTVDRIVLYVDDLDRCSSERVVDVLTPGHAFVCRRGRCRSSLAPRLA
ncbi:hypothetical protein AB0M47_10815 [Hamadaea sp. NPDC051192]|uniref:hypothetical protein n=1 Tax=Hamadaea sp. NPDC051192 TaxID=3154940 RepID=UPI003439C218